MCAGLSWLRPLQVFVGQSVFTTYFPVETLHFNLILTPNLLIFRCSYWSVRKYCVNFYFVFGSWS